MTEAKDNVLRARAANGGSSRRDGATPTRKAPGAGAGFVPYSPAYAGYLRDESRLLADGVETLYFPQDTGELAAALARCAEEGTGCVLSGGRTGITGAASPLGARALISLERLKRVRDFRRDNQGTYHITLEAGVTLAELAQMLEERRLPEINSLAREYNAGKLPGLWLPVNPTESGAQIGGAAANNASGARSYRHGALRGWITGLEVVLVGGGLLKLRRGEVRARDGVLVLEATDGTRRTVPVEPIAMPRTKCTCGYWLYPQMDAIDLFIGSEGTLGALSAIELRLVPVPEQTCGVVIFCPDEAGALQLAEAARKGLAAQAIEYFDPAALALLRRDCPGKYPSIAPGRAAVYLEFAGSCAGNMLEYDKLCCIMSECNLDPAGATWAAETARELEWQRDFRHAVPETVNNLIARRKGYCPGLHKVGTDMAVPFANVGKMLEAYRQGLREEGLEAVIFGHLGDGHLHVNILPEDMAQLTRAKELYSGWAREAVALGGAVAAEHGIGRLKRELLRTQWDAAVLAQFAAIRQAFDPAGILAPGVLL